MAATEEIQLLCSHTQTVTAKDQLNQAETAVCSCIGKPFHLILHMLAHQLDSSGIHVHVHCLSQYTVNPMVRYSCILEQVIFLSVEVTDFVLYFK